MRVLVTGWRRGIGQAVAEQLESQGDEVIRFEGDVVKEEDWAPYAGLTVDGLVNCAGVPSRDNIFDVTSAEFARVIAVNLWGPILGMQTVLPGMIERKHGSVVNVTSIYAEDSGNGRAVAYHASKAALSIVTRNAAKAVAVRGESWGVRVNEVRPGFTRTRLVLDGWDKSPAYRDYIRSRTLSGDPASPFEAAAVICFLLSDAASFVNGASWAVDGGWLS